MSIMSIYTRKFPENKGIILKRLRKNDNKNMQLVGLNCLFCIMRKFGIL